MLFLVFFFFQAEDGIRDKLVTGVQTCALPISWYWTRCIAELGAEPIQLGQAYQDRYLSAAGLPANLMEVLAITQVFEARVIGQYNLHRHAPTLHPAVKETLDRILEDEKWHIQWVRAALEGMESKYGPDRVRATLER